MAEGGSDYGEDAGDDGGNEIPEDDPNDVPDEISNEQPDDLFDEDLGELSNDDPFDEYPEEDPNAQPNDDPFDEYPDEDPNVQPNDDPFDEYPEEDPNAQPNDDPFDEFPEEDPNAQPNDDPFDEYPEEDPNAQPNDDPFDEFPDEIVDEVHEELRGEEKNSEEVVEEINSSVESENIGTDQSTLILQQEAHEPFSRDKEGNIILDAETMEFFGEHVSSQEEMEVEILEEGLEELFNSYEEHGLEQEKGLATSHDLEQESIQEQQELKPEIYRQQQEEKTDQKREQTQEQKLSQEPSEKSQKEISQTSKINNIKKVESIREQDEEEILQEFSQKRIQEIKREIAQEKEQPLEQSQEIEQESIQEAHQVLKEGEIKERYKQETGRRPIYAGKETRGFIEWKEYLKQQKEGQEEKNKLLHEIEKETKEQSKETRDFKDEWAQHLANSIKEAEFSEEIRNQVNNLLEKYEGLRELLEKLKNKEISEEEFEKEVSKFESILIEKKNIARPLFMNFDWFRRYYNETIRKSGKRVANLYISKKTREFLSYISGRIKQLENRGNLYESAEKFEEFLKKSFQVREKWALLLNNLIDEVPNKEISKEAKKELETVIKRYSEIRTILFNKNILKEDKEKLIQRRIEKSNPGFFELFEILKRFLGIYDNYSRNWMEQSLVVEGKKTIRQLSQKLDNIEKESILHHQKLQPEEYFEIFCQDLANILYSIDKISENTIDAVSRYLSKNNDKLIELLRIFKDTLKKDRANNKIILEDKGFRSLNRIIPFYKDKLSFSPPTYYKFMKKRDLSLYFEHRKGVGRGGGDQYRYKEQNSALKSKELKTEKAIKRRVEKNTLLGKLTAMRDGTLFPSRQNRFENFLDNAYARLLLKLDDSISEEVEYKLKKIFYNMYSIFGFEKKNIFYRKSKILLYQLAIILNNSQSLKGKSLVSSDSLNKLTNEFFIDNYRYSNFYDRMNPDSPIPQSIPTIKNLQERTINSISTLFNNGIIDFTMKQKLEHQILPLIQNYLDKARKSRNLIALYEEKKKLYGKNTNINRIKLLEMIYTSHSAFLVIDTQSKFSKLLFGRTDYIDTLFFNNIESRPKLSTLYRIIYNSLFWSTTKDFDSKIDNLELNLIKEKVKKIIEKFVFSDAYPDDPYIPSTITRFGMSFNKNYLKSEYHLTTKVWLAMALHENDSEFNWEKAISKYNVVKQGILLNRQGGNIGKGILKRVLEITNIFIKELPIPLDPISSIKMDIYTDFINSVNLYAANRYLALDGLSYDKGQNINYHVLFNDPRIVATNIILHLLMYAGINPYNGRFLKPELFDGDSKTDIFGRHHLFELEKYLFACGATVTLPRSFHNHIEYLSKTMYGKEIQEKLLSTVNNMVLKDGLITLTDIDNYLSNIDISLGTDNITVADLWKGGRTTQELNNFLNRWNKARKEIKKSKFYGMINENFKLKNGDNPILEKYWGTAQNVIAVYRMVEDFNDFSYLFTQNDKKFLKKFWKI